MITNRVQMIREMLAKYQRTTGVSPRVGHSILVDISAAVALVRDVTRHAGLLEHVDMTDDTDELFRVSLVPVRLRADVAPGMCHVVPDHLMPRQRSCCDLTACQTIMMAMARGEA